MERYTPGPWVIDDANNELVAKLVDGVYEYIADCQPGNWSVCGLKQDEIEANARLIASAPDLLEACKGVMNMLDNEFPGHPMTERVRGAIDKAKGE